MTAIRVVFHGLLVLFCLHLVVFSHGKMTEGGTTTEKTTKLDGSNRPHVTDPGGDTSIQSPLHNLPKNAKIVPTSGSQDKTLPNGAGPPSTDSYIGSNFEMDSTNRTNNNDSDSNQGVTETYTLYGSLHSYFDPKYYYDMVQDYRSKDSFWSLICLCFVVGLLLFIVWWSRMWRARDYSAPSPEEAQRLQQQNWTSLVDLLQSKFKYLPRKLRQKLTKKRHASQQKKFDTESDWHIIEDEDYISSETELIDSDEN